MLKLFELEEGLWREEELNLTQVCHKFFEEDEIKSAFEKQSCVLIFIEQKDTREDEIGCIFSSFKGLFEEPSQGILEENWSIQATQVVSGEEIENLVLEGRN